MKIEYDALEKRIGAGTLDDIYLLYGNEQYLINNSVKKIKKRFGELIQGINYIVIDQSNVKEIVSDTEIPAFGYEKKIIIAKNTGLFEKNGKKDEFTVTQEQIYDYLKNNIDNIKDTNTIIFVENDVEKNALYDLIDKNGVICNISEQRVNQLVDRLKKICSAYKVDCETKTLYYLIETSGTNFEILINEIRKLIEYEGARR